MLFRNYFLVFVIICLQCIMTFKLNKPLSNLFLHMSITLNNNNGNSDNNKRSSALYGVPKKKSSHRRTRRRKLAWMKKNPAKLYQTSAYDIDEIMRYTDRKLTTHYTTRDNWLNLPPTTLINDFFLFREIRK
ncbi:conserved protein, unknown function [Hepatocystis sp. ex Piliocolobus tephrosceles]|nr:conserved protein, unknown function [Hepatocystis sp. ex Piliocolobus tephrosceles]